MVSRAPEKQSFTEFVKLKVAKRQFKAEYFSLKAFKKLVSNEPGATYCAHLTSLTLKLLLWRKYLKRKRMKQNITELRCINSTYKCRKKVGSIWCGGKFQWDRELQQAPICKLNEQITTNCTTIDRLWFWKILLFSMQCDQNLKHLS